MREKEREREGGERERKRERDFRLFSMQPLYVAKNATKSRLMQHY